MRSFPENGSRHLVAGTRGSRLARAQTDEALARLRQVYPGVEVEVRIVRTGGDRDRVSPLSEIGGRGVFAKELELALIDRGIDFAVHSLKDLPPVLPPGLVLAAVPPRADVRDALVTQEGQRLADLPPGATIGTGSARRRALLLRLRPDLLVRDVRGNVETRIRLVRDGRLDGVVLAAAGLARLGLLHEAAELFPVELMLPAPGQGALALEAREDDARTRALLAALEDPASRVCAEAERRFLARLGSGCTLPTAAYAGLEGDTIVLRGVLAAADGSAAVERVLRGPVERAAALGAALAEDLLAESGRRAS